MKSRIEATLSTLLTVASLVMAAVLIRREVLAPAEAAQVPDDKPVYFKQWRDMLPAARVVGDTGSEIKVVEFADFECPFCRKFNLALKESVQKHPDGIALYLIHLPLPGHRFARPAARAAECANETGQFKAMVDVLFANQDSLGLQSWIWFGKLANVPDTTRFSYCATRAAPLPKVEEGVALADKLGIHATPTIFVNGWRFRGLTHSGLEKVIQLLRAGKPPYIAYSEE